MNFLLFFEMLDTPKLACPIMRASLDDSSMNIKFRFQVDFDFDLLSSIFQVMRASLDDTYLQTTRSHNEFDLN